MKTQVLVQNRDKTDHFKLNFTNKHNHIINNVIILGEMHTFTKEELKILEKNFSSFNLINYDEFSTNELKNRVNYIVGKKSKNLIVLNQGTSVPNNISAYLKNLEQKGINSISLNNFMKDYLYKCYLPEALNDKNFIKKIKPFNGVENFFKFLIDYSISLTLLISTFPIILFSIYKIKKESPGPIFFKQKRVGLNGKEFECIKFRSMVIDAEKNGAKFATKNDDRVYSWGKIMRATRIDELPQLWNVLRGDMHLIGPRPERKIWIQQFEKEIPYYNERHVVKPGLTGWAQVLYPYGENAYDAKQKLMYDLYYIKHWNLWLEIKTIWKTVMVVLNRKGI